MMARPYYCPKHRVWSLEQECFVGGCRMLSGFEEPDLDAEQVPLDHPYRNLTEEDREER